MGLCFSTDQAAPINSVRLHGSFTSPGAGDGRSYRGAASPAARSGTGSGGGTATTPATNAGGGRPAAPSRGVTEATAPRQPGGTPLVPQGGVAVEPPLQPSSSDEGAFSRAMQRMGKLSNHPLLAVYEATEAIASEAGADLASVSLFLDGETDCSVLLAAFGEGAAVLERSMAACRGPGAAAAGSSVYRALDAPGGRFSVADAASEPELPADLAQLHHGAGLASFEALVIPNPLGDTPLGTLLVGKTAPHGFGRRGDRLPPALSAAAASLVPLLRQGCVSAAARVVRPVCQAPDAVAAIRELLSGVAGFMMGQENLLVAPRLALLVDGLQGDKMLMFEPVQKGIKEQRVRREGSFSSSGSPPLPASAFKEAAVRELSLKGTLLHHSIEGRRASVVHDIPIYIQNSARPARDVLMASSGATSLALVPMMMHDTAIGALYVAAATRVDFGNIQETLIGLVPCLTLAISSRLGGGDMKALVAQARRPSLDDSAVATTPGGGDPGSPQTPVQPPTCLSGPPPPADGGRACAADADAGAAASSGPDRGSPQPPPAAQQTPAVPCFPAIAEGGGSSDEPSRLEVIPDQRLPTEAMMKVLRRDIRRGRRCSMELSFTSDLSIEKEIGRGGFGTVYYGKWRNAPAAIKVANTQRAHSGDAVPDAMELAVLNSVSHPHIVQLLSCLLNMVLTDSESAKSASPCSQSSRQGPPPPPGAEPAPRFSRIDPNDPKPKGPTYNLIVLEYCDRGSLRAAIRGGIFHCRLDAAGRIGVDLASITEVLLDVATAVQYLHDSANLVHGDLKLDNVLLKSDPHHTLGFTPKLGDFGLSKVLNETHVERRVINRNGAGTLTHLAPEMFTPGAPITTAVDVYAWGILMWEAFTSRRAFSGLSPDAVRSCVVSRNMRPGFPPGAPAAYVDLASRCWARNPADRPSFVEIVYSLRDMRTAAAAAAVMGPPRHAAAALAQQ